VERLRLALRPPYGQGDASGLWEEVERAKNRFVEAMDDDLNTAQALASLFDLVKAINQARDEGGGGEALLAAQATLRELAGVLGLRLEEPRLKAETIAPFIELLLETRAQLRQAREWELADGIRARLAELGVILEDDPQGTTWRWG
jgi:cysteinyl-tRNA synthetase